MTRLRLNCKVVDATGKERFRGELLNACRVVTTLGRGAKVIRMSEGKVLKTCRPDLYETENDPTKTPATKYGLPSHAPRPRRKDRGKA